MTTSTSSSTVHDNEYVGSYSTQPDKNAAKDVAPPSPAIHHPEPHDPVSPSVSTPFSNSPNFKAGLLLSSWRTLHNRPPLPGKGSFSSRLTSANRMGHAGNGMASNLGRFFSFFGKALDPYGGQNTTLTALQAGKSLGNAVGYAIDFSKVEDKQATVRNYLHGPLRQGTFSLLSGHDPHEAIMLVHFRPTSVSKQSQTTAHRTGDAQTQTKSPLHQSHGTQTGIPARSRDTRTQTEAFGAGRAVQTQTFTQSHPTQTDSD
ncbi:hypothetical protein P0D69_46155, partial [Paraburkholderia sediminicola]